MKKYISLFLCILLLASCSNSGEKRSRVLKVYNWADYIDEEVLTEFPAWYKEQTGEDIRIIYQVFDINEIMLRAYNIFQLDFSLTSKLRAKNLIIDLYITLELVDHLTASDLVLPLGDHFPGKGSGRCLISRRSFIIIIKQTADRSSPVIYQRTMSDRKSVV